MKKILFLAAALAAVSCTTKARFSGEELNSSITRDIKSKEAILNIDENRKWKIFAGPTDSTINLSKPVMRGEGGGSFVLDVPKESRSYFLLKAERGEVILAERFLPMEGVYNLRDLGGYKTKDGRYIRWGKLFRSDELHNLTATDLDYINSLQMTTIVDLRSEEEINAAPDPFPASLQYHYDLSINPGNLSEVMYMSYPTAEKMFSMMEEMNRLLVSDSSAVAQYRKLFALMQDESQLPLLFHCTAGKDRAGMGAALFLYSLGVQDGVVYNDYLLSKEPMKKKYGSLIEAQSEVAPLMLVDPDYLTAGMEEIEKKYGSVEKFLTETLGVNLERMKEIYLY